MSRLIALFLGAMLCLSVAMGSVAHAAEGPVPLESGCSIALDQPDEGSTSSDGDEALSHAHACHGHHIGVPLMEVQSPEGAKLASALIAVTPNSLPSIRPRTQLEPPRA